LAILATDDATNDVTATAMASAPHNVIYAEATEGHLRERLIGHADSQSHAVITAYGSL